MNRMRRSKIEKEEIAATNQNLPVTTPISRSDLYQDETNQRIEETIENEVDQKTHKQIIGSDGHVIDSNGIVEKKPRIRSKNDLNAQKCLFSPFAYHRFTRSHKERTKDGDIHMVLRCRYCFDMVTVRISFVLKDGKYIATKETLNVEDANASLSKLLDNGNKT